MVAGTPTLTIAVLMAEDVPISYPAAFLMLSMTGSVGLVFLGLKMLLKVTVKTEESAVEGDDLSATVTIKICPLMLQPIEL